MASKYHVHRYLWTVSRLLPGSRIQKKRILSQVENAILEFASENPYADYKVLVTHFGDPQKIAESCVAEMNPDELLMLLDIRQSVLRVIVATVTVLMVIYFGIMLAAYFDFHRDLHGYAVVEVIEMEDIPNE